MLAFVSLCHVVHSGAARHINKHVPPLCCSSRGLVNSVCHLAAVSDTEEDPVTPPSPLRSLCFGSSTLSQTAHPIIVTAGDTAAVNLNFVEF